MDSDVQHWRAMREAIKRAVHVREITRIEGQRNSESLITGSEIAWRMALFLLGMAAVVGAAAYFKGF